MSKDYQTTISGSGSKRSAEPVRRLTPGELGIPEGTGVESENTSWENLQEAAVDVAEEGEIEAAGGSAVLDSEGSVWTANRIETDSESIHPTRVAILSAVSNGETPITKVVLYTGRDQNLCGSCRELIHEFSEGDAEVRVMDGSKSQQYSISELLPK